MKKGKLGISLTTYAVIAFVLAIFGQMLIAAILLGFVLYAERDEWAGRQCMQAFFLTFASGVIGIITVAIFFFTALGSGISYSYYYGGAAIVIAMIIPVALWILVLVFEIRGLVRVVKGQEADVPLLSGWAYRAYGYVRSRQNPPPQGGYGQGGYPPPQGGYPPQGGSYPPPPPPPSYGAPPQGTPPGYGAPPAAGSPYGSAPPPPKPEAPPADPSSYQS